MKEHIFIVDTNVLVAGLITGSPNSPTSRILDAKLTGNIFYLFSEELLQEYRNVLLRPAVAMMHGLGADEIDNILAEIAANGILRSPQSKENLESPDPNDEHLWSIMALEPSAILVTGDQLLIDNPGSQGTFITPTKWAQLYSDDLSPCL